MLNTKRGLSLIVLVSLFALTIACKKSSDSGVNIPESTMSFKMSGTDESFTNCVAVAMVEDSVNILTITGLTSSDASKSLTIMVGSKDAISTGFTINQDDVADTEESIGIVNYLENSTTFSTLSVSDTASSQFEIHITEKTSTNVKGTFSAKLFAEDGDGQAAAYTVTEGKFNAKIQDQ